MTTKENTMIFLLIILGSALFLDKTRSCEFLTLPVDTNFAIIGSSKRVITGLIAFLAIVGIFEYISTRKFITFFVVLVVSIYLYNSYNINRYFTAINTSEYREIKSLIQKNPKYINILPNYVDSKCEMQYENYKRFKNLISSPSTIDEATFHIHKSANDVEAMCANTVFKK